MRLFGFLIPNKKNKKEDKKEDKKENKKTHQVVYEQVKHVKTETFAEKVAKDIKIKRDEINFYAEEGIFYVVKEMKKYIIQICYYYIDEGYDELVEKLRKYKIFNILIEDDNYGGYFKIDHAGINISFSEIVYEYAKSLKIKEQLKKELRELIHARFNTDAVNLSKNIRQTGADFFEEQGFDAKITLYNKWYSHSHSTKYFPHGIEIKLKKSQE